MWSSIFSPVSSFAFLRRYGRLSPLTARHDLPYHVVGSDLAGVVLRTGPGVTAWQPGREVVAHCLSVELDLLLTQVERRLLEEYRTHG